MRILVVSDTHIRSGSRRRLPDAVYDAAVTANLVLHAGDLVVPDVIDDLERFAPVTAVLGNNDGPELARVLPAQVTVDVDGVQVALVHDAGPRTGRPARLRRRFPGADVVIFGHSHIPLVEQGVDGQVLFNPGSPTERRRQPQHTYGLIEVAAGRVTRASIEPITR
jgi:hypothetical protein